MVKHGTARQTMATLRHSIKLPKRKTTKNPRVAEMPTQAVRMPLIDGWLRKTGNAHLRWSMSEQFQPHQISPMYVRMGASISPMPQPKSAVAMKTISMDEAKYISSHAAMCGMFTMIIALFRPSDSPSHPERQLPTGWQIYAMLPNQDAWEAVKCRYSCGLCTLSIPVNAGMRIVGKANARPMSRIKKFLMVLAKICGKTWRNGPASGSSTLPLRVMLLKNTIIMQSSEVIFQYDICEGQ